MYEEGFSNPIFSSGLIFFYFGKNNFFSFVQFKPIIFRKQKGDTYEFSLNDNMIYIAEKKTCQF